MRRSDHPSRPSAITCCRFSALKTLPIPAAGVQPTAQVNVSAPGAALAGFQVSINGRFWVSTEVEEGSGPLPGGPFRVRCRPSRTSRVPGRGSGRGGRRSRCWPSRRSRERASYRFCPCAPTPSPCARRQPGGRATDPARASPALPAEDRRGAEDRADPPGAAAREDGLVHGAERCCDPETRGERTERELAPDEALPPGEDRGERHR